MTPTEHFIITCEKHSKIPNRLSMVQITMAFGVWMSERLRTLFLEPDTSLYIISEMLDLLSNAPSTQDVLLLARKLP